METAEAEIQQQTRDFTVLSRTMKLETWDWVREDVKFPEEGMFGGVDCEFGFPVTI